MPDYFLRRYAFPDADGAGSAAPAGGPGGPRGCFSPPVDLFETLDGYELRMEIAGVDPAAVEVLAGEDGRTLTIHGLRSASPAGPDGRFLNLEIQWGEFSRRVVFPEPVDYEAATACYLDGFLVIQLPRLRQQGRRRVPIAAGG
jgi:HSP20 family protein